MLRCGSGRGDGLASQPVHTDSAAEPEAGGDTEAGGEALALLMVLRDS